MMTEIKYILLDHPDLPDWDEVAELFTRMYAGMDKMGLMLPLAAEGTEKWLKTAKNTGGRFGVVILAKDKDKAAGFAHGMIKFLPDYLGGYSVGSVTHVFVDEKLRKSGIGKELVVRLEEWFRQKKVGSVELQVISGNPEAEEFWKKLGYARELVQYRKTW